MALFNSKKKKQQENESTEPRVKVDQSSALLHGVVAQPHITEKSSVLSAQNKYVFQVLPSATKIDVKNAIEKTYKVKVTSVHMIRIPSKTRRVGRYMGTKAGIKKAIVSLKSGDRIDVITQ